MSGRLAQPARHPGRRRAAGRARARSGGAALPARPQRAAGARGDRRCCGPVQRVGGSRAEIPLPAHAHWLVDRRDGEADRYRGWDALGTRTRPARPAAAIPDLLGGAGDSLAGFRGPDHLARAAGGAEAPATHGAAAVSQPQLSALCGTAELAGWSAARSARRAARTLPVHGLRTPLYPQLCGRADQQNRSDADRPARPGAGSEGRRRDRAPDCLGQTGPAQPLDSPAVGLGPKNRPAVLASAWAGAGGASGPGTATGPGTGAAPHAAADTYRCRAAEPTPARAGGDAADGRAAAGL